MIFSTRVGDVTTCEDVLNARMHLFGGSPLSDLRWHTKALVSGTGGFKKSVPNLGSAQSLFRKVEHLWSSQEILL